MRWRASSPRKLRTSSVLESKAGQHVGKRVAEEEASLAC